MQPLETRATGLCVPNLHLHFPFVFTFKTGHLYLVTFLYPIHYDVHGSLLRLLWSVFFHYTSLKSDTRCPVMIEECYKTYTFSRILTTVLECGFQDRIPVLAPSQPLSLGCSCVNHCSRVLSDAKNCSQCGKPFVRVTFSLAAFLSKILNPGLKKY